MTRPEGDDPRLLELTDAILDGRPVDWATVEGLVPHESRGLVRQLRLIASVGRVHEPAESDPLAEIERTGSWGCFRILGPLGRGSYGVTYRALDTRLDREVALKLTPDDPTRRAAAVPSVEEARLLARVRHPNVVAVHSADRTPGCSAIAMELVQGRTLEQLVREGGPLSPAEAALVGVDVCRALAAVHHVGVIHGDVKAQNVMRAEGGRIVLMDFGTGRERGHEPSASDAAGTPLYLAPELLAGEPATTRSDIYSVGVLLYWLVTAGYPIAAGSLAEVREAHRRGSRRLLRDARPDLPEGFVAVVERALARPATERYATAGEMEAALMGAMSRSHPASTPPSPPRRLPRTAVAAAAVAVVAALAATTLRWMPPRRPSLPFAERDWVLVGEVENRTGEAVLEGTLRFALERELANSRFASVVPRERIGDTLKLMKRPPDARIDDVVGREIALRDGGIRAVITGRAEKVGGTYLLTASLTNPATGVVARTLQERAGSDRELLAAVEREAVSLRDALGETLAAGEIRSVPLEKVTTPSLRALQLYSQGMALMSRDPMEDAPARELFVRAVQEDPDFAMSHLLLAYALCNLGRPGEEFAPHAERAFQLADRTTTEYERYFILGGYHQLLEPSYWPDSPAAFRTTPEEGRAHAEQAAAAFEALLRVRPNDYWAAHKLRLALLVAGRPTPAELPARIADVRPKSFEAQIRAAGHWFGQGDVGRGEGYVSRARALRPSLGPQDSPLETAWLELLPAHTAWLENDAARAESQADEIATSLAARTGAQRDALAMSLGDLYQALGLLDKAEHMFRSLPDEPGIDAPTRRIFLDHLANERGDIARCHSWPRPGQAREARALLAKWAKRPGFFFELQSGQLALSEGRDEDAMASYRRFFQKQQAVDVGTLAAQAFRARIGMATLMRKRGEVPQAIRVLEEASTQRRWVFVPTAFFGGCTWLRVRSLLASLYRDAGREDAARAVEKELRTVLARADAGHPVLRKLQLSVPSTP